MSDSGIGFGGFLLGLGLGWYFFKYFDIGFEIFSYLLILLGIGIILGALLSQGRRRHPISGIYGGVIGGLFLAAFLTQGFSFITNITDEFSDFPGDYKATETFTENTPLTADSINLDIYSVNGGIDVSSWSGDSVKFDIEVKARGDTTARAENNLADFEYELQSELSGAVQEITLSFPIPNSEWTKYSTTIEVLVPTGISTDYDLRTINGAIILNDIISKDISLDTTNGAINLSEVTADRVNIDTINGEIEGKLTAQESTLSTTNGAINIGLTKTSGTHAFSTTNGGITLTLPTDIDIGYKLNLDTSIGSIDVNLPNIDYSIDRTRTKVGETSDYSGKTVQVEITADTTIGGIELN